MEHIGLGDIVDIFADILETTGCSVISVADDNQPVAREMVEIESTYDDTDDHT